MPAHAFVLVHYTTPTSHLIELLKKGVFSEFAYLSQKKVEVFSSTVLHHFMEEEARHDIKILTKGIPQSLQSMSSGERKKALLHHLLKAKPEVLLLVNPYDNLDRKSQQDLKHTVQRIADTIPIIQIGSRIADVFPFIQNHFKYDKTGLQKYTGHEVLFSKNSHPNHGLAFGIPAPLDQYDPGTETLVHFEGVSVSFNDKPVLKDIHWSIKKGEFWQLKGPNGSGKSTLLNMITGDSHKGYGQNLSLFGRRKGSGESVWDIKEAIGYFTPAMIDRFKGYHSLESMLISGFRDSVGLYHNPSDTEQRLATEWLRVLGLERKKGDYFNTLSEGGKRLIMIARAMIKHPPLLILDEPTIGLDDESAAFFVALVNAYAAKSTSAVVFVSHREEEGLDPDLVYELHLVPGGARGRGYFL